MPTSRRFYPWEQFTAVRRSWGLDFSPDGREVVYATNISGQFNLWKQSVEGGWPWQLTTFENETVRSIAWSPKGDRLIFTADEHGNEFHQIYSLEMPGGWPVKLTDKPKVQHDLLSECFSPDGDSIAYACNERVPTDMDAMLRELRTGEAQALMAGNANYFPFRFSPDGRYVTIVHFKKNTDTDILLYDLKKKTHKVITQHEGDAIHSPGPWRPDSQGFYLVSDRDREFAGIAFYDLKSEKLSWVERPNWDVEDLALTKDGRYLAWVVNEDGLSRLYIRNLETRRSLKLPPLPAGVIPTLLGNIQFSPDGSRLAFYFASARQPADLHILDLEERKMIRLTHSMIGEIPDDELVEPKLVRIASFDGRKIPAWLYEPKGLKSSVRVPAVLSIHGGPEAQERPVYNYVGLYQYLLSRGIGILATNIRGSTGYGKSYQKLIHRDFGGGELKDLEAAAKYLQSLDWVNGKRLGVFGGSFGGFATLSCATRLPEYWAAAVDIVGPSNLVTFARAVPPFWKRFMKDLVGDPDEDHKLLMERSPITYVNQLQCPILIIQGANDPRVVKSESDQMVDKLRSLGRNVDYVVFDDEGHGFTKRANELKAWRITAEFLESRLLS